MKKTLILIALAAFCGGLSLQASPVSPEKALDVAKKIFDAQKVTKAGSESVKIVWDGEFEVSRGTDVQPAFYVVARDGGGWVMVAGDDNVRPVLGISTDGHFETEGMPDNVRWWMDRIKAFVRAADTPEPGADVLWEDFTDGKSRSMIPGSPRDTTNRFTPQWGQTYPFNEKCPMIDNQRTLTGCVATAIAEVLTYQSRRPGVEMPDSGTGSVGGYEDERELYGYSSDYVAPEEYELGTVYMWDKLRRLTSQSLASQATEEIRANLAQLFADIGATVHAFYGLDATSASLTTAPSFMAESFGFNKAAYFEYASSYSTSQWIEKLRDEIVKRPVLYRGSDPSSGGHAFVLDGFGTYQGTTVFHVNFGWNGWQNGYYYVDNLTPQGSDFSVSCGAVFDFYPDANSSYTYKLEVSNYDDDGYKVAGLAFIDLFSISSWFRIKLSYKNIGTGVYNGILQAKLVDKAGVKKADLRIYVNDDLGWTDEINGFPVGYKAYDQLLLSFSESPSVEFGDMIVIYYSTDEDKTVFEPLINRKDGTVVNGLPIMPAAFIKAVTSYSQNDIFTFELSNYDYAYAGTVWTITDPDGISLTKKQSDKSFVLSKSGKYKIEAAVAETVGGAVIENIVTYITVVD